MSWGMSLQLAPIELELTGKGCGICSSLSAAAVGSVSRHRQATCVVIMAGRKVPPELAGSPAAAAPGGRDSGHSLGQASTAARSDCARLALFTSS